MNVVEIMAQELHKMRTDNFCRHGKENNPYALLIYIPGSLGVG